MYPPHPPGLSQCQWKRSFLPTQSGGTAPSLIFALRFFPNSGRSGSVTSHQSADFTVFSPPAARGASAAAFGAATGARPFSTAPSPPLKRAHDSTQSSRPPFTAETPAGISRSLRGCFQ